MMKLANILIVGAVAMLCSCQSTEDEQSSGGGQVEKAHLGQPPVFTKADLDADGQLSTEEVATFYHQEQLGEYDLNDDSHISESEWVAALPSATTNKSDFNSFDKDGDGQVSESEAVSYVTEHVSFGDSFKKYDEDGNFNLHWQEVDAAAPTELSLTLFSIHPKNS